MTGLDVLRQLAIPVPPVQFGGPRSMGQLLHGMTRELAGATRGVLEGGSGDDLIAVLDRAERWPPLAAGVHVAAEVLAHVADARRVSVPHRPPTDDTADRTGRCNR